MRTSLLKPLYHQTLRVAQATKPSLNLGRRNPIAFSHTQACCFRAKLCQGEALCPQGRGFKVSELDFHLYLLRETIIPSWARRCTGSVADDAVAGDPDQALARRVHELPTVRSLLGGDLAGAVALEDDRAAAVAGDVTGLTDG
jgi:hypothetical protein